MNQKSTFLTPGKHFNKILTFLCLLLLSSNKVSAQQTLYAISGYNATDATLYKLNAATGAVIGTIGNTGLSNVTNMTVNPLTGEIYAQASRIVDSQLVAGQMQYAWQGFLYLVDSLTAVAVQVETTTAPTYGFLEVPYIIYSPTGNRYTIGLACHCVLDQIGINFNNICHLFFKDEFYLSDVDTLTGNLISYTPVNGFVHNMFAVDINDNFYSGERITGGFILKTINANNGFVGYVGQNSISNVAALAFGPYRPAIMNGNNFSFCAGGSVDLMAPAGDTYQWKLNGNDIAGTNSQAYTATQSGSYSVVITIGCGTYASAPVEVNVNPLPVLATNVNNIPCFGGNNGSVDLTVTGAPAATFSWSNGAASEDISGLAPGTYSVNVIDINNCSASTSVNISQPASALSVSSGGQTNATSGNNGSATVVASGGTAPYTYSWSPSGGSNATATGLGAGTYIVTVTDDNGCSANQSFTIVQDCNISFTANVTNVACNGQNNGAINVTITSGPGQYTYSWSNGATTQNLVNRPAGTYTLTVSTANGCSVSQSYTITQPEPLSIAGNLTNVSCHNAKNGAIGVAVSGGTPPYTYQWADVNSGTLLLWILYYYGQWCNNYNTGWPGSNITTPNRTGLDNGCYYVKVTDANGCTAISNFTIQEPSPIYVSHTKTNSNCAGTSGSINQTVSGGTSPYTYQWSNGATTEDISGLAAGNYSVTITDANGCTSTQSYSLSQATANINVTHTKTNAICTGNTGSINITVSGGSSPYTYLWSNGATTQDISNISAGTYTVLVTDANGCTKSQSIAVSSQSGSNINVTASNTNAGCANNNGIVNITVSGGQSPYTYQWSNGAITQDITGLSAGAYSVVITDKNGCTTSKSYTISQSTGNISISNTKCNAICTSNTGSIDISVSGGQSPYSYQWSNGATTQDISNIPAGSYTVLVTDAGGCTKSQTIAVSSQSGSTINVTAGNTNAGCANNNGIVNITVSGGQSPYTYQWSNGATTQDITGLSAGAYSVVITDKNGCTTSKSYTISQSTGNISISNTKCNAICTSNTGSIDISVSGGQSPYSYQWSNGATTQDISNIPAGSYTVLVTDAGGCTKSQTIAVSSQSGSTINVTASNTNTGCTGNTGIINITVSGGQSPYTYQWSNGATTQDISGLATGNYSVVITDKNGCTTSKSYTISQSSGNLSANINVSPQHTVSGQQAYTIFLGYGPQSVTLSASISGGASPYTRSWSSTSSTNASISVSPTTTTVYTLTVTDKNGCTATATRTIIVKDVRANNNKINVCHNGTTTAVNSNQVESHLCHGDYLGTCMPGGNWCRTAGGEDTEEEPVIAQLAKEIDFKLFPNPTNGSFTVAIPAQGNVDVIITDISGRVVERKSLKGNTEQHLQFNLEAAPKGVYLVRVSVAGELYQSKVTVQ